VLEAFALLLSFRLVISNDLVEVAIRSRCRKMYAVQITNDLLQVVVHTGTVTRNKTTREASSCIKRSPKNLSPAYPKQDIQ
jgi:hypothetical protein